MLYYSHAAEYHNLGDKQQKSMNAANQATLLALQKSLFINSKTTFSVLQLSEFQFSKLVSSELR